MRCSRCGNENSEQNRFCGMCGGSLLAAPVPAPAQSQPVQVATPTASHESVAARAEPAPPPRPTPANPPSISGPSFLGLSDPPSTRVSSRKRARLSIDPHAAPGGNLDYLLSDEEPPQPWGPGKILLILIALALAVGFGYLRFRTHGFAFLNPTAKKPDAAIAQNTPNPDTSAQPAPSASTPEPQPSIQLAPPASSPAPDPTASNSNPAATTPPASADSAPATSNQPAPSAKPNDSSAPENPDTSSAPDKDSSPTAAEPAAKLPIPKATEKPRPTPKPSLPKPSPATRPVAPADSVAEARKYIYGKGAAQDCERGMRLLKPAANQLNPKAMIEMGALYSAGLCTPRDLPTAYRWFALALRKDPENTSIHADLSKLWKEMTPAEQQLAIKLTQ